MQALSHFSYLATGGYFVLCDLQGAVYDRCALSQWLPHRSYCD